MFELKITDKNLLSHWYLHDLVAQQNLKDFRLIDSILYSPSTFADARTSNSKINAPKEHLHKLVIFTEALHLQQLTQVTDSLAGYVDLAFYRVITVAGVQGFAICAYVSLKTQDNLNQQLENTAELFSVELCLCDSVPTLAQPGLLLMDMDSTVIAVECIDEIASLAGVGEQVSAVTAQAMQGKLDFAQSLRTRVACLEYADESILQQVRDALPLMPGVANLIRILKTYHWKIAIASGGFSYFADYLKGRLNLDSAVANDLQIINAKLTGKVKGDIVDAQVKAQTLKNLAEKWSIAPSQTIAMGDGANDLLMMNAAALGVALHAKPIVRQQADMAIRRSGLDSLLWVLAAAQR
ncbi:phosphoserine phosphatase SerB [uncultured Paraglaciecola sp.]|uniref:phosphoserine phosphatase SerB n=1 Tax=uncultured Paraglaciecola sp. TaxID=1765024 RepID=UPI00260385CC|nr:phosphoserine phosphatase SerB [uncultured Paraglaciecola sp.]